MADVSKHTFEWVIQNTTNLYLETKSFPMQVRDLEVVCNVNFFKSRSPGGQTYSQAFVYELTWPDSDKPIFYSGQVEVLQNGVALWSDKKATPNGDYVSSSKVFPRGIAKLQTTGQVTITLNFEFDPKARVEKNFMSMLKEKILTDVVVVCGKESFDCHKIILAKHSNFFEKMLTGTFKEANEHKIVIKAFAPDVVKLMIEFIYTSDVPEDAVTWELFEAAKMYVLPGLQDECLRSLRKKLNVDSSCKMLESTFKHDLEELFDYAMEFVKNNKNAVAKTDGWKAVTKNNELLAKILIHLM